MKWCEGSKEEKIKLQNVMEFSAKTGYFNKDIKYRKHVLDIILNVIYNINHVPDTMSFLSYQYVNYMVSIETPCNEFVNF